LAMISPPAQMCQPEAHKSAAEQPVPFGFGPSLPFCAQFGLEVRSGAAKTPVYPTVLPLPSQPPAHAAIPGKVVVLTNTSRVPSAQPMRPIDESVQTPPEHTAEVAHAFAHAPPG